MSSWFLVEDYLDHREALVAARVPFSEIEIGKPRPIKGLAFPEEERARVLEILGLSSTQLVEVQTDREEVHLLEVWKPQVVLEASSNMDAFEEIKPVLREYAEMLGVEILVSNPHGEPSPAKTETGKLFLRFWSTPAPTEETIYSKVFGFSLGKGQCDGLQPSGQGIPIQDPDGLTVAELVEGTLYVLFDLPHRPSNAAALMRAIMEQVVLLQKSPEERERWLAEAAERERKRSREAYVRECGRRLQSTIAETRKSIEQAERTIRDVQKAIVEAVRAEADFRKKLEQLTSSKADAEKQFAEEFDRLLQVPGITRVTVQDGIVSVFTEEIDIAYQGNVYEIGKFRVDIFTSGEDGGVRCFNLTRQPEGYCHPHVKGDGRCCLGNIADGVAKLIGTYEYSILAQVMLQYLRTVNPSSWYCDIKNWPVKEPAGKKRKRK